MNTGIDGLLGREDWEKKKSWIEDREPSEPSAFHIAEALWYGERDAWLEAYSEYVRVKATAIGEVWDTECILWFIEIHQFDEIDQRFGEGTFSLLEKRVKAERDLPIDPTKIKNAREFCRPFEDYYRAKAEGDSLAARSERAIRQLIEEMNKLVRVDPATYRG